MAFARSTRHRTTRFAETEEGAGAALVRIVQTFRHVSSDKIINAYRDKEQVYSKTFGRGLGIVHATIRDIGRTFISCLGNTEGLTITLTMLVSLRAHRCRRQRYSRRSVHQDVPSVTANTNNDTALQIASWQRQQKAFADCETAQRSVTDLLPPVFKTSLIVPSRFGGIF